MEKIAAPFDGKNLCDDSLRDVVFSDCFWASDMKGGKSHMIGPVSVDTDDVFFGGIVDAQWNEDSNTIRIELVACPCPEDFSMREDFFRYYEGVFKEWEQGLKDNSVEPDSACVEFKRDGNVLYVSFWWLVESDESDDDPAQDVYAAYGEDIRKAVAYINEKLETEDKAIIGAMVDKNFKQHMNPSYGIDDGKIIDLLEEYGDDHDLGEGWWEGECELDDIVLLIQFED